jgi:hypothetical protein
MITYSSNCRLGLIRETREDLARTDKRELDPRYQMIPLLIIEKFSEEIKSLFHTHAKFLICRQCATDLVCF